MSKDDSHPKKAVKSGFKKENKTDKKVEKEKEKVEKKTKTVKMTTPDGQEVEVVKQKQGCCTIF